MKIGIELCEFYKVHAGGKDEVAYNLLKGFEKLGCSKDMVCFCNKELESKVKSLIPGAQVVVVPRLRTKGYFKTFVRYVRGLTLKRLIKKYNIDLLMFTNKLTTPIKFPIKTIVIPHDIQAFEVGKIPGLKSNEKQDEKMRKLLTLDFKLRDYVVAISDYDKAAMIEYMPWSKNKIRRIYNPISFNDSIPQDQEKKYITALNIQWEHKNVKTLIYAFSEIADKIPYTLKLVGRKPDNYDELISYINECNIQDKVHFTGYVSNEELVQIISETRIYVNPSFYEGFGMTAVEMMGACIPTITSTTTAIPEVTMGLCRYYEPVDDAHALSLEIMNEINSPKNIEELKSISEKVINNYSYLTAANNYWKLFEEILNTSNSISM